MIQSQQKTSLLIPHQLPKFISEDPAYANFVLFLQAYYEWMEEQGNTLDFSKNILNYMDVDTTTSDFMNYFMNDFMGNFPKELMADQTKVLKIAKQLYQSKGTPASYQFLFRVLYNTDVDFFYTKDVVFKASAGKWYVPRSLKLATSDSNFLKIQNLRVFGEFSKSIATVETAIFDGLKTEVFISNIERLFQSGEAVRVVDSNNQTVYFLNGNIVPVGTVGAESLRAIIVGQISQIIPNSTNRGLDYQVRDPVVVYGGLNPNTANPIGAIAQVGAVTSGSIQRVTVTTEGYGYSASPYINLVGSPNTAIGFIGLNKGAAAPIAIVGGLDPNGVSNVSFIPVDSIGLKRFITLGAANYYFSNLTSANINTSLANSLNFTSFSTYPISSVIVENQGGGISIQPTVIATSYYNTDDPMSLGYAQTTLSNLGILAPIQILNAGAGYRANDTILITGGSGYGAYANVVTVNTSGGIQSVGYVSNNQHRMTLGGMGYMSQLPSLSVSSANTFAANASLYVPGILGTGATFSAIANRVGSITSFNILNNGEDYISAPTISLKVQDLVVSNVFFTSLPSAGDVIYQGANTNTATYMAIVDTINALENFNPSNTSIYQLRTYNYSSKPKLNLPLKIDSKGANLQLISNYGINNTTFSLLDTRFDAANGVITYGDGTAKANATFLNGLVIGNGQYLDTSGQPSASDVLQSTQFNNYTYEITLEKEIAKYRDVLLNLLHPTGTQVIGRFAMKSNSSMHYDIEDVLSTGHTLSFYTGAVASNVTMTGSFNNPSNNQINFGNLAGANIANIVFANTSTIRFTTPYGDSVDSLITSVNPIANTATLKDSVWLAFSNVATVSVTNASNIINIKSITNSYNIVNNGNYSNTMYPLMDIVRVGDIIKLDDSQIFSVVGLNYGNNTLIASGTSTSTNSSEFMSVLRTLNASNVQIFGPVGQQYFPEITDEIGNSLTTENGFTLILG